MLEDMTGKLKPLWEAVLDDLVKSKKISDFARNIFFSNTDFYALTGDCSVLKTSSPESKSVIEVNYCDMLSEAIENHIGYATKICVILDERTAPGGISPMYNDQDLTDSILRRSEESERAIRETEEYFKRKSGSVEDAAKPVEAVDVSFEENEVGFFSSNEEYYPGGETNPFFNSDYTFENFIVGTSNQFAHAAALAVAENPATKYNPLLIYGPSGIGKTHLLYAITNKILEKNPSTRFTYVKGDEFTNQMVMCIKNGTIAQFREKYRKVDLLLLDDIQFISGKTATQEEFFHTFNALYESHKQIIATSDRPPREMLHLEERIRSRLEGGLIADIEPPAYELRLAILKNKADLIDLNIPEEILVFLAEKVDSNIRQIEGVIKKLSAKSFLGGVPITFDMVKDTVPEFLKENEPVEEKINKIIQAASEIYGVSIEEILGTKRTKDVKMARNVSMYVIRELTTLSLGDIGKVFNRDHSTVHSNCAAIEKALADPLTFVDSDIDEIKRRISD